MDKLKQVIQALKLGISNWKQARADNKASKEINREIQNFYKEQAKAHSQVRQQVIEIKGKEWLEQVEEYLREECLELRQFLTYSIETEPKGELQKPAEGDCPTPHEEEWVNQTTNGGYTGDTYEGDIYIKLKEECYLCIPYTC